MSLFLKLKNQIFNINTYNHYVCKGAKRKMERTQVLPTEHLINITKNRRDPYIISDDFYPPWVMRNQDMQISPSHYEFFAFTGQGLPEDYDCPSIFRTLKKRGKQYKFESGIENTSKREFKIDDRDDSPPLVDYESEPEYVFSSGEEEYDYEDEGDDIGSKDKDD